MHDGKITSTFYHRHHAFIYLLSRYKAYTLPQMNAKNLYQRDQNKFSKANDYGSRLLKLRFYDEFYQPQIDAYDIHPFVKSK
jgi:hypothetical protein